MGLATARELILRHPSLKFAVLEKEKALGIVTNKQSIEKLILCLLQLFIRVATTVESYMQEFIISLDH